jgi:hypothetical protein
MCMACEMEAMWFAAMEARARAVAPEADAQAVEVVDADPQAPLLPLPERGRVGEAVASSVLSASVGGVQDESADPHPNPPSEEGGGGASSATQRSHQDNARRSRFSCEETQGE